MKKLQPFFKSYLLTSNMSIMHEKAVIELEYVLGHEFQYEQRTSGYSFVPQLCCYCVWGTIFRPPKSFGILTGTATL